MILFLQHKWFDMIADGEKFEEYRAATPWMRARVRTFERLPEDKRIIEFRRGYTNTKLRVWCRCFTLGRYAYVGNIHGLHLMNYYLKTTWGFDFEALNLGKSNGFFYVFSFGRVMG